MDATTESQSWAEAEFAEAKLGDRRRQARLVSLATGVAESPGGTITRVFGESAEREAAYRFLENEEIVPVEIGRAALKACLGRTKGLPYFLVPVDGSSITLTDREGAFGFGTIGARKFPARGLEVVSAIGVSPEGTPLGYCGQQYWARPSRRPRKSHKRRPLEQKETRYLMQAIDFIESERHTVEGAARPWYLVDRAGDFKELLAWGARSDAWLTIRANADRTVSGAEEGHLWSALQGSRTLGHFEFEVSGSHGRKGRRARINVRVKKVDLSLKLESAASVAQMWAVLAEEVGTTPAGEDPIEWMLLTNFPVADFAEASMVIRGYSYRWRIEDFHRTWKTTCRVEDAQLRSVGAVQRWAVALGVVAMRIQRLTHLARTQPDLPATEELTTDEVTALLLHKQPKRAKSGFVPTIGVAVTWIAEMGGYTGKSSGGPPGAQTIARGMQRLVVAASTVAALRTAE